MNTTTVKNVKASQQKGDDLKTWLESKPYWEKYLWYLNTTKEELEDSDIEKCYQYLLEDSNVVKTTSDRVPITFSPFDLQSAETPRTKVILNKIENLQNINAVDDSCVLEFGKNLTIIYGDNGAGKSGIGRLFSNACYSRKPREILPNVRIQADATTAKAKADFHITDATGEKVINYTIGDIHDALKSFSVFDHECSLIHLDSNNAVEFVPSKMHIFDEVFNSMVRIESKLEEDMKLKSKDNPTEGAFSTPSKVKDFLANLSADTTEEKINEMIDFTASDKKLLDEKNSTRAEKQKQDISKRKQELYDESADLEKFRIALEEKGKVLSATKAEEINKLIKEISQKKEIAEKISLKSFQFSAFKNIGSPEWRSLIATAKILYDKETAANNNIEPAHCLLCQQPLNKKEEKLFAEYWKFLNSTVENELAAARKSLKELLDGFYTEKNNWPAFSDAEIAIKILEKDIPDKLKNIQSSFTNIFDQLLKWIDALQKEQEVNFYDFNNDISSIKALIDLKKETAEKLIDPAAEIKTLTEEIVELTQKQRAYGLILKIKEYVLWLRWKSAVEIINIPTSKGNITRKKNEIMSDLVISQYVGIFNEETKKLDCNFGLTVESRGRDAQTVKGLKLDFARGYSPSEILSDGEQTVSALADFLTEAKLNKSNSGIIFDDPVSSLDHLRKDVIAQSLVEEAKERQVIILTHDIIFLLDLQFYAERESVGHTELSIEKNGEKVGISKSELPWVARNVKSRVAYLKNELAALKKLENGDQNEYRNKVKLWYELLRESWERAVEERLFKGVVQRFNKGVQTQRLPKVEIDKSLIKEVETGMSDSSKWLHDTSAGVNPAVPTNTKLNADIDLIEKFILKCKAD